MKKYIYGSFVRRVLICLIICLFGSGFALAKRNENTYRSFIDSLLCLDVIEDKITVLHHKYKKNMDKHFLHIIKSIGLNKSMDETIRYLLVGDCYSISAARLSNEITKLEKRRDDFINELGKSINKEPEENLKQLMSSVFEKWQKIRAIEKKIKDTRNSYEIQNNSRFYDGAAVSATKLQYLTEQDLPLAQKEYKDALNELKNHKSTDGVKLGTCIKF